MDDYLEIIRELENMQYKGIEFAFDMSMRDFLQWFLNLPFYVVFMGLIFIICLRFLLKLLEKDLSKK